jgi:molecular chaperone Hsp33
MSSKMITGMTNDKSVRFFIADTTQLVQKASEIHDTTPVSTAAFGRTLTGAAIMGRMLKNDQDRLTFQINGSGEIKSILVVSDNTGNVKGYISAPHVDLPIREDGKLDVGGAIGKDGNMIVIKDYGLKTPFIGKSALVSGEVAEDLANYFMNSEQQPSIVSLGVNINPDLTVKSAGGIIIQPMPEASDEVIDKLEALVAVMPTMTELFNMELSLIQMAELVLNTFGVHQTSETEIDFLCDCSKEKFESGIVTLGESDIQDMIDEDGQAEVQCHFCNQTYHFEKSDLENILKNK